jgi:type IV pilus assembly protein PilV
MNSGARGFTLVEALIALLLLSVGMLGAWNLQLASLRDHNDSLQQTTAMELLRDMAERIRANPSAGSAYASEHASAPAGGCTAGEPCTASELAAIDVAWFAARAAALFPGSDTATTVEFAPATGPAAADDIVVALHWRGARARQSAALHVPAPPVAG